MSQPPAPTPANSAASAQPKPAQPAPAAAKPPPKKGRNTPPGAGPARLKKRHYTGFMTFLLMVAAPLIATIWYLQTVAADQYASYIGFAVRSEELDSAQSLLGGLSALSGTSSSDTEILYEFIQSQTMVQRVSERLDLPAIYARPEYDPIFAYEPTGLIEDLHDYWGRMVDVSFASGTGLLELRVLAFDAEDAHAVATAIVEESSRMINDLSAIAREDATEYARDDLDVAIGRLKTAREALTRFRSETQIVDPMADIQGQQGLLNSLEEQLATAFIDLNLLLQGGAASTDPRVQPIERRIAVITDLIEQERQKFGVGGSSRIDDDRDYSTLVGEFERLTVDVRYAEDTYIKALNSVDVAIAEAARQSRYLAIYAEPSMPQSPRYPQRAILILLTGAALLLVWSIAMLVYYSLRDRR